MNADFRKGKQIDNKDPQSFNLRLCDHPRFIKDLNSVELCVTLW